MAWPRALAVAENVVVTVVARVDGEIATFFCNNNHCPFDCPKGKVAAA